MERRHLSFTECRLMRPGLRKPVLAVGIDRNDAFHSYEVGEAMTYVQALLVKAKGHCGCPRYLSNSPVTKAAFKTVYWENKMINLQDNIADDPEFHTCRMLLQFEQHGAVINYEAYILEDKGYLSSKLQKIPPFSDPVTLYELTPLAAKTFKNFERIGSINLFQNTIYPIVKSRTLIAWKALMITFGG